MAHEGGPSDRRVVLLGPQQQQRTVAATVADLGIEGDVATVTAGWEERENEDAALSKHLGGRTRNLALYPRAEEVFAADPGVRAMLHERHDRLRDLQAVYRLRLAAQLQACRVLIAATDPAAPDQLYGPEIESAIAGIRALDEHHLGRTIALDEEISDRITGHTDLIERHRDQLRDVLRDVDALLIAGGHVGTLLNRLRLFEVLDLAPDKPVVAWSGGAMAVAERVVLFHDSPPQGPGDPAVHARGFGLVAGVVPLPHAGDRLRLDDPARVALFARRFEPDLCVALNGGDRLDFSGGTPIWDRSPVRVLGNDGAVRERAA